MPLAPRSSRRALLSARLGGLLLALLASWPALAQEAPRLALPLDCIPGRTCHIQNYVDADPGPGARDFTCSPLTYDGHKGTDFALPDLAVMRAGVTVRAAAPGRVTALRDGMADTPWTPDRDLDGKDCGNGLVIDHGDGWETQYCHMARGSLMIRKGQQVDTGAPLGRVGLSGRSQFPHLHLSLRHDGQVVDPFAPDAPAICGTAPAAQLWADPLSYQPGGIISTGFLDALPDYSDIKAGTAARPALPADSPALVLWANLFGARAGDRLSLVIHAPDGPFSRQDITLDRTQAQLFRAHGKRLRAPLAPGLYTGRATLIRDGKVLSQTTSQVQITR
ncbi:M23 family metallopeptidase [Pseudooceanicola marinus]|uniref:M23 family metallopeptidase n=1 Tax=Pseudooceanicola marinus TaxID=396013 RepID=UPI00296E33FE|nr:M23 family metallopeptidase [Pseudooceanicola marinus]